MPTQASQKRWKQILQTIYEAIEDHGTRPRFAKSVNRSDSAFQYGRGLLGEVAGGWLDCQRSV